MNKTISLLFVILSLLFCSCNQKKNVDFALQRAGDNRQELKKVIDHYSQSNSDSLKLKATYFLIVNMYGIHYYQGKLIDDYYKFFNIAKKQKSKRKTISFTDLREIGDSISQVHGQFSFNRVEKLYDLQQITADYLIKNIDIAFKVWNEQPWGKYFSFDQFCEYILPYRVADENPFDYNRTEVYAMYKSIIDSVCVANVNETGACIAINNKLKKEGWLWTDGIEMLPHFGAKTLLENRVGVCREYADIATYTMRAAGIPVAIDFTPQWPHRNMGHTWNVLLTRDGKSIPFMGVESNPGVPHKADHKMAKVYRNTFAIQPQSLAIIAMKNDILPPLFHNPRFYDVSDEYFEATDVTIPIKNSQIKDAFAYICVFDNRNWIPIHWGRINYDSVTFTRMGRDIVYLPAFYTKNGLSPFGCPFLLTKEGRVNFLKPNLQKTQKLMLTRKYPVLNVKWRLERMIGGMFQGANYEDFRDSVLLHVIDTIPSIFYQTKTVNNNQKFRFVRYRAPRNSHGNIAELEFYGENDSIHPLEGKIIGDGPIAPGREKEKAMDGNTATFFDAYWANFAWVGLDLGSGKRKKKIRFIPVNDGNNIDPGDEYELFYFDERNGWISCGRQFASSFSLIFNNVPSDALYLLRNYSKGTEERIFTYENDKQVWW